MLQVDGRTVHVRQEKPISAVRDVADYPTDAWNVDELFRLSAIAVLGCAGCALGAFLIRRILRRVRLTGTLARV